MVELAIRVAEAEELSLGTAHECRKVRLCCACRVLGWGRAGWGAL